MSEKKVKVNKSIDGKIYIAGIPENVLPVIMGFFIIAGFFWLVFRSWKLSLFLFLSPSLTYIILVGQHPHKFLERFFAPRRWFSGDYQYIFTKERPLPTTRKREKLVLVNFCQSK